jgi:hypothetical protein
MLAHNFHCLHATNVWGKTERWSSEGSIWTYEKWQNAELGKIPQRLTSKCLPLALYDYNNSVKTRGMGRMGGPH